MAHVLFQTNFHSVLIATFLLQGDNRGFFSVGGPPREKGYTFLYFVKVFLVLQAEIWSHEGATTDLFKGVSSMFEHSKATAFISQSRSHLTVLYLYVALRLMKLRFCSSFWNLLGTIHGKSHINLWFCRFVNSLLKKIIGLNFSDKVSIRNFLSKGCFVMNIFFACSVFQIFWLPNTVKENSQWYCTYFQFSFAYEWPNSAAVNKNVGFRKDNTENSKNEWGN